MVRTGLSVLIDERLDLLTGRRIGLVSHNAAVLPDLTGIVDALLGAGLKLSALFGAEHGFSGAAAAGAVVGSSIHRRTGLPLHSLYGAVQEPLPEMLAGVDVLVVDFQDVGARFYTFLSTLFYVLRAAGRAGMPVVVLDRPNPLNGSQIEGTLIQPGFESFVGMISIPVRHGMTLGELALLMNHENGLGAALTVVPMQGWERQLWFDQTGLPWVTPSPAMAQLSTAAVYPGMCFVEGTNLSEGRGTALPFETAGAPWLDCYELARSLNRLELAGVRFRPHSFQPSASKYAGQVCEGVQVHVIDRAVFEPVRCGLQVVAACRAQNMDAFAFLPGGHGAHPHFDLLAGSADLRTLLESGGRVEEWGLSASGQDEFLRRRAPYLLYR